MKTFELKTLEFDTGARQYIESTEENGRVWGIPIDEKNSRYQEYLRYTAWVEAGNTPEDFWTQDDELADPTEPTKKK